MPRSVHVVACCLGLALYLRASESDGLAVRWRADGNTCLPYKDETSFLVYYPRGLILYDANGNGGAACPVPLQSGELDITPASSELLNYVSIWSRLLGGNNENVLTALYTHDHADADFCECDLDEDVETTGTYFVRTLSYAGDADSNGCDSCPGGGAAPSDWSVVAVVELDNDVAGANNLTIVSITAYDQ